MLRRSVSNSSDRADTTISGASVRGSCSTTSEASSTLPNRSSFWLRISNVRRCASLSLAMKLTTVTSRCWL